MGDGCEGGGGSREVGATTLESVNSDRESRDGACTSSGRKSELRPANCFQRQVISCACHIGHSV